MAANPIAHPQGGSFLLELLRYAGWELRIRDGKPARIHATRDGVVVDVTDSSLSRAAGTAFARAMRARRHGDRPERS
jgi:hypothetical protein